MNQSCVIDEFLSRENLSSHWEDFSGVYIVAAAFTVIFLTGVPLNLYIIAVLIHKKLYTQPTFLLLLNLTFADLFLCLIPLLFNIIAGFAGQTSFGSTDYIRCQFCKIGAAFVLLGIVSIFTVVLLSVDRLIFFRAPLRYERFVTLKKTVLALVVNWVLSIALTIPPFWGYGDFLFASICGYIFFTLPHLRRSLIYMFFFGPVMGAVAVTLTVTNVWILILAMKVLSLKKKLRVHPCPSTVSQMETAQRPKSLHKSGAMARKQIRFFQIIGAIILVNTFTFIPAIILAVMVTFTIAPVEIVVSVQISVMSLATLHPLVQVLFVPELRRLLTKPCKSKQCFTWLKESAPGKCWSSFCTGVESCCMSDLWTKELEKQLRKMPGSLSNLRSPYNTDLSS